MTTEDISTQPGAYVHANGIDIYYEEYGSGYPLLLIHGGLVNHTMWDKHIPTFAQHFRVIAPDSRGHGRTKNPISTLSYRMMADDMAAFIQALGLQQPLVCGYSDGGQIALEMALHHPHVAKAYVAGAAVYYMPETTLQITKEWGLEGPGIVDFEKFKQAVPGLESHMPEWHDAYQGTGYWKRYMIQFSHMAWTHFHYSDEALKQIEEPILLLAGDHDELDPIEHDVHMYRLIPRAELAIAPGSSHGFFWLKPELLIPIVLDFLLRHTPLDALDKAK